MPVLSSRRLAIATVRSAAAVTTVVVMNSLASGTAAAQSEPQMSAGILAVQVRKQGFTCTKPQDVTRDAARSTPANAMWVLRCANATYRVHLVPKMAARVEKVE